MIPSNSAVAAEVRSLLQGADDSSFDSVYRELCQLVDCSPDGCILLLQVCLDEVLLNVEVAKNSQSKHDLLCIVFRYCLDKPYFSTCFCEALRILPASDGFLETLSNEFELSAAERVGIGLALSDSENLGWNMKGQKFSIAQIEELCSNPVQYISNDQIHDIVVFLHQTDGLSKHMDSFTNIISLFKVKERPFYVPVPIQEGNARPANSSRHIELYIDSLDDDFNSLLSEIGKEISMADIITELGYGCTSDIAHCKEILSLFEPLDDMGISKLLGAVVCTRVGLDNITSQPQAHWTTSSPAEDCAINSEMLNNPELAIYEGTISRSSQYSQELLRRLNRTLQNSGIDLSQASISVQINLGKQAIKRSSTSATSTSKELIDPASNSQTISQQLRLGDGAQELLQATKHQKPDNS